MHHVPTYALLCLVILAAFAGVHWWMRRRSARGLSVWIWAGLVLILATGALWSRRAVLHERRHLETMVAGFAPTYASELARAGHEHISESTPPHDALYIELIRIQHRWQALNPSIADVYTFRPAADGSLYFVVDAETDYDGDGVYEQDRESRTPIGERLETVTPAMRRALRGEACFDSEPVADRWGTWVSAYVPMLDRSGRVDALLGVDYDAHEWLAALARARLTVMGYIAALAALLGGFGAAVGLVRAGLEARVRAAEEIAQFKTEFLANMSHEIRTPLGGMLGYADLLLDETLGPPERAAFIGVIRRNGDYLLGVIDGILDFSKLEADRMQLDPVDCSPAEIAGDVATLLRPRAEAKGLRFRLGVDVPAGATLRTDPLRLRQILVNLVGNAIKFTDSGSVSLELATEPAATGEPSVVFRVHDTGIGLTPEQLTRVFDPFMQADSSTSRRYGGTGLGLPISRRLAQLLGGDIEITSHPGRGSTFTLRLRSSLRHPAAPVADAPPPPATPPAAAPRLSGRILLAEDGEDNQRLFTLLLTRAGAHVETVGNGRAAADRALAAWREGRPFDLVLMDMQMPELDGYSAASLLRREGYPGPIIALTAHSLPGERAKCLAAGCNEYLAKPVQRDSLLAACAASLPLGDKGAAVAGAAPPPRAAA